MRPSLIYQAALWIRRVTFVGWDVAEASHDIAIFILLILSSFQSAIPEASIGVRTKLLPIGCWDSAPIPMGSVW